MDLKDRVKATFGSSDEASYESLAKLSPLEYDKLRMVEAKRIGIRMVTLDKEVARRRPKGGQANGKDYVEGQVLEWPKDPEVAEEARRAPARLHRGAVQALHRPGRARRGDDGGLGYRGALLQLLRLSSARHPSSRNAARALS